ncbi:MAG TPA: RNA-splicing ligase RtcB [Chitinophagaceae bacterium]|nr:RNA-splicing ligase RtcB [Chitinophagaceae bacterium]
MNTTNITAKELRAIGYPESPVIPIAMQAVQQYCKHQTKAEVITLLTSVLATPEAFLNDEHFGMIAQKLMPTTNNVIALQPEPVPVRIYGEVHIQEGALRQMNTAAHLPISVAGALMPDAHQGYGLPIGGVLATRNAVIPYGVGVDIGCRMCLSIFDMPTNLLDQKPQFFSREIGEATLFGSGAQFNKPTHHEVLDDPLFKELPLLQKLHDKAWKQLGSSGSGNHFVEFGKVTIRSYDTTLQVPPGDYIGLLSHSGSRALGATIANHYTQLAMQQCKLPQEAAHLAWLSMNDEAGIAYWLAMNLAGNYASACHHIIHAKIAKQLGMQPITMVENHHNFAWKEILNGEEVIVHRKGATPAGKDVLGIIPGSMTANGYIVKGKGEAAAINSASHGAGRQMSRTQALKSITKKQLQDVLAQHGVTLLGGGLDEAPFAYKDIETVMESQQDLVSIVGTFAPRIVKMCGDAPKGYHKKSSRIEGE